MCGACWAKPRSMSNHCLFCSLRARPEKVNIWQMTRHPCCSKPDNYIKDRNFYGESRNCFFSFHWQKCKHGLSSRFSPLYPLFWFWILKFSDRPCIVFFSQTCHNISMSSLQIGSLNIQKTCIAKLTANLSNKNWVYMKISWGGQSKIAWWMHQDGDWLGIMHAFEGPISSSILKLLLLWWFYM